MAGAPDADGGHPCTGKRPAVIAEPTAALDLVVERFIRPRFKPLICIVRAIVGNGMLRQELDLVAESVVGQCVHLVPSRQIVMRMLPRFSYSCEDVERLAGHVAKLRPAALDHLPAEDEDAA